MDYTNRYAVTPGTKVDLSQHDPADTAGLIEKLAARNLLHNATQRLDKLQYLLYAENKHSLLVVLQGMDAAGKDGTIRHVMGGFFGVRPILAEGRERGIDDAGVAGRHRVIANAQAVDHAPPYPSRRMAVEVPRAGLLGPRPDRPRGRRRPP